MSAVVGGDGSAMSVGVAITPDGGAKVGGDSTTGAQSVSMIPEGGVKVGGDGFGVSWIVQGECAYFSGTDRHRGATRLPEILWALKQEIVNAGIFLDHHVYTRHDLAGQSENPPSMDDYLEIFPLNELSDQAVLDGAGRFGDLRAEPIELRMYHHLGLDQKNRHTHWTIDACRGASRKAGELLGLIQLLDIVDSSGTGLLAQPMRVKSPTSFQTDRRGWGFVPIRAEIVYTAELELVP